MNKSRPDEFEELDKALEKYSQALLFTAKMFNSKLSYLNQKLNKILNEKRNSNM